MRIPTLLQKISELTAQPEKRTAIDVDLMLDYTRVLYADLLEWRSRLPAPNLTEQSQPSIQEPTLAELAAAMEQRQPASQPVPQTGIRAEKAEGIKPEDAASSNIKKTVVAEGPQRTEKDIRSIIGINDKYQIMSELFSNDREAYEQALDFINQSRTENAALAWLREQLWITEERSEAAQSFFEIVGQFFRRES